MAPIVPVLMRHTVFMFALFFSGLAVAQGLPRFGTARFGQAAFGSLTSSSGSSSGVADSAVSVPFMPLWATISLAVALWILVYLMRPKES